MLPSVPSFTLLRAYPIRRANPQWNGLKRWIFIIEEFDFRGKLLSYLSARKKEQIPCHGSISAFCNFFFFIQPTISLCRLNNLPVTLLQIPNSCCWRTLFYSSNKASKSLKETEKIFSHKSCKFKTNILSLKSDTNIFSTSNFSKKNIINILKNRRISLWQT